MVVGFIVIIVKTKMNTIETEIKKLHQIHLDIMDFENKMLNLDEMEEAHNDMERDIRFADEEKEYQYISKHC